jgi:5-methylcytosine-specific restriction protein A
MPYAPKSFSSRTTPGGHGVKPSAHQRGYTSRHRRRREIELANKPLCRICAAAGRVTIATEIDHIVPFAHGGSDDDSNRQPVCSKCNNEKSKHERRTTPRGAQ